MIFLFAVNKQPPAPSLCNTRVGDLITPCSCEVFFPSVCFQGNVGPAAFWLLGYLLTNPEALTAVKREFGQISQMASSGTPLMDKSTKTPVFGEGFIVVFVTRLAFICVTLDVFLE